MRILTLFTVSLLVLAGPSFAGEAGTKSGDAHRDQAPEQAPAEAESSEEDGRVWTNADLKQLFGEAPELDPDAEAVPVRDDAADWEFVEKFIDRQHGQIESRRRADAERREAEEEEEAQPVYYLGGRWPFYYRPPGVPWLPRPHRPDRPHQQPRQPDHKMVSPNPRLDDTAARINERRDRIEAPHTKSDAGDGGKGPGGPIGYNGGNGGNGSKSSKGGLGSRRSSPR